MPKREADASSEMNAVLQEKNRVEKHIDEAQKRILLNEKKLDENAPATQIYQQALEEWHALQAYLAELQVQVASLDEVFQDLKEPRFHSDLLLPS